MMDRSAYVRVGLLILGGLGLMIGLVVFLSGNRFRDGVPFETYFRESVQGLEVGAPVKLRGVTLGRVTDIGLVSAEYGRDRPPQLDQSDFRLVFVRFVIDPSRVGRLPSTELAVRAGLRARVAQQGITGISYIELDFVEPKLYPPLALPWTPKAEYIPSMPSTLTQVQDAAQQFLAKLNSVDFNALAAGLTGLVTDLRTELRQGDAHAALVNAAGLLQTLQDQVRKADLPALSDDLRRTSTAARETIQGKEVRSLLANAATAADRLSVAAGKLPPVIAALEATARRTDNGTADLQQSLIPLLRDLQATVSNLRETSEALRQYPAGVLFGSPPPRAATGGSR
jgi:ABC-type transporter Mla subunit MlaD